MSEKESRHEFVIALRVEKLRIESGLLYSIAFDRRIAGLAYVEFRLLAFQLGVLRIVILKSKLAVAVKALNLQGHRKTSFAEYGTSLVSHIIPYASVTK